MGSNIWRYDHYDLRRFKQGDVKSFLDIGGNKGIATLTAWSAWADSDTKVAYIEPHPDTYSKGLEWMGAFPILTGVSTHCFALGDGSPLHFLGGDHSGLYRFGRNQGAHGLKVPSYTLPNILRNLKVSADDLIIKMDCEGGERFVMFDEESLAILYKTIHFAMEIHYDFNITPASFILFCRRMAKTHVVRRVIQRSKLPLYRCHIPDDFLNDDSLMMSISNKNQREWTFTRKDWDVKRPTDNDLSIVDMGKSEGWL